MYTKAAWYKKKISDGSRSALLVIVALIITTTYQTALQPPGGVYQSNAEESSGRKSVGKVVMNQTYFKVVVGRVRVSWRLPFYQLEKNICGIFYG